MKTYIPHTFRVRIPNAREVAIVGDFNNWHSSAHPMVKVGEDLWERLVDLPEGPHRLGFFVIDDLASSGGSVRSRVVASEAVMWAPEALKQALQVTAHPSLTWSPVRAPAAPFVTPGRRVA